MSSLVTCYDRVYLSLVYRLREGWSLAFGLVAMACANLNEAAMIQSLLKELGLTGQKLAFSEGSEWELTEQLVSRLGVEGQRWQYDYVRNLVRGAVEMADLDRRLQGSATAEGLQRIRDAQAVAAAAGGQGASASSGGVIVLPPRGTLGKSVRLRSGRLLPDEEAEDKVLKVLFEELEMVEAPVLDTIKGAEDQARAQRALFGRLRLSTIRRYLAYWQRLRQWVHAQRGNGVRITGIHLVDYLYAREKEGLGASIPLAVMKSVQWFEALAEMEDSMRISHQPFVTLVVSELTRKLESKAPPIKRAPRWLGLFVAPMEDLVMSEEVPDRIRVTACFKLFKLWGGMRFSDAAHIKGSHLRFYDDKVSGTLVQTKTTGAGKKVRELPIYIGPDAYVKHPTWLRTGLKRLRAMVGRKNEYVFVEGLMMGGKPGTAPVTYAEAGGGQCRDDGDAPWGRWSPVDPPPLLEVLDGAQRESYLGLHDGCSGHREGPEGSAGQVEARGERSVALGPTTRLWGPCRREYAEITRSGRAYDAFDRGSGLRGPEGVVADRMDCRARSGAQRSGELEEETGAFG